MKDQRDAVDKKVEVTFVPPNTWTFDPLEVPVEHKVPTKIMLVRADNPDGSKPEWLFVTAVVHAPNGSHDFKVDVPGDSGKHLIIHDKSDDPGRYAYQVTVTLDDKPHTSPLQFVPLTPPPVIVNAE